MSFIKIKDPRRREELIKDFIETMKRIKDNFVARKVGESDCEKLKLIKPFVRLIEEEKQEEFKKELSRYYNEEETEDEDKDDPQLSTSGEGLKILPSDPNALLERFDLLFSSQKAGHTGVRNEIVSILDELKRQGVINTKDYKKLNSIIKK